jgi:hypothetical protein
LELERSRERIADVQRETKLIDERLALLPSLEETLKRFQEAGLEERLKEKSLLVREERLLATMRERLTLVASVRQDLSQLLPIDTTFLSAKALEELPNGVMLAEGATIFERLSVELQAVASQLATILDAADTDLSALRARWDERRQAADATYAGLLGHQDHDAWLTGRAGVDLLQPAPNDLLRMWPVSRQVNVSGRGDDDRSLIEPIGNEADG